MKIINNERETMSKNLKKLIERKGIDQKILADHLNISEMSVSNWVNGIKYPRMGNIQRMADYFGVMKSDIIEESKTEYMTSSEYHYLPTAISAGLPIEVEAITESEKIRIPDALMGKWAGHKDIFITKIFGDSMNKTMPDGSIIAVKPTPLENLKDDDIVVYSINHDYSVKRLIKQADRLVFRPHSTENCFTDQIVNIENNELLIHGKVVLYMVEMD